MRVFSRSLLALAIASLTQAKPLTEETSTAVRLDSNQALLESGELVVHVLRTDDLLSDFTPSHERSLILERLTHLVLRVHLDQESSTLAINDQPVDLSGLVGGSAGEETAPRVQMLKASAYRIPKGQHLSKHVAPQDLEAFADMLLPQGIVSVELSVEEEAVESTPVDSSENEVAIAMRSYKVFVKITEIESHALSHSTTVLVPLLKVQLSYTGEEGKPVVLKAFALRPHRTGPPHHHHEGQGREGKGPDGPPRGRRPPHHSEEDNLELDAPVRHSHHHIEEEFDVEEPRHHRHPAPHSDEDEDVESPRRHRGPGREIDEDEDEEEFEHEHGHKGPHHHGPPHRHPHGRGPPPFVRWLADVFGFAPPRHHRGPPPHHRGPPHGHEDSEEESHRPHRFAAEDDSEVDELIDAADAPAHSRVSRPHPPSGHRHHRHHAGPHRLSCRLRRFLHSPLAFAAFVLLGLLTKLAFLGAVGYFTVRKVRAVLRRRSERREGAVRLQEEGLLVDGDEKAPRYEDVVVVVRQEKA